MQLDRAGPRLPVALAVAITLNQPLGILLAVPSAGQAAHFELHQPLGRKTDHVAQKIGVRGLSYNVV